MRNFPAKQTFAPKNEKEIKSNFACGSRLVAAGLVPRRLEVMLLSPGPGWGSALLREAQSYRSSGAGSVSLGFEAARFVAEGDPQEMEAAVALFCIGGKK